MASDKVLKLIEEVKVLTVLELSELVKALEEEFGVSAAAPMAVVAAPVAAAAPAAEEKTEFDVILKEVPQAARMPIIKLIKDTLGLSLKDSKDLVEAAPKALKEGVSQADADDLKKKFEEAGASVEIK